MTILKEILNNSIQQRYESNMKNKEFLLCLVERVKASFNVLAERIASERKNVVKPEKLSYVKLNKILVANLINLLQLQFCLCDQDSDEMIKKLHDGVLIDYDLEETFLDCADLLFHNFEDDPFTSYERMFKKEDEYQDFDMLYQKAKVDFSNMIKSLENHLILNEKFNQQKFDQDWEELINFVIDFAGASLYVCSGLNNIKSKENKELYLYNLDCIILKLLEVSKHSNFILKEKKKKLETISKNTVSTINETKLFELSCFIE